MKKIIPLRKYSFAIYGLGISGKSVINYLKNKKVNEIFTWDDELFKNDKKKLSIFKSSFSKPTSSNKLRARLSSNFSFFNASGKFKLS